MKEVSVAYDNAKTVGARIKSAREKAQLTQLEIAKLLGLSRAAVAQWELDTTSLSIQRSAELAKLLDVTPQWIAFGIDAKPVIQFVEHPGTVSIPEVMFGSKASEIETLNNWTVPNEYLKSELHCLSTDKLIIWRVEGDDMAPSYSYGDKVIVDTNAKRPSPSGVFLLWDGIGPSLRNVSVVPSGGKSIARVSTGNGGDSYEVPVEKLVVIGRARGVLKSL